MINIRKIWEGMKKRSNPDEAMLPEEFNENIFDEWAILMPKGDFFKEHPPFNVKYDATPKMWQVWTEGYAATGEHHTATYHGEVRAETFEEACRIILGKSLDLREDGSLQYDRPAVWNCRCFDNEADARKSFG